MALMILLGTVSYGAPTLSCTCGPLATNIFSHPSTYSDTVSVGFDFGTKPYQLGYIYNASYSGGLYIGTYGVNPYYGYCFDTNSSIIFSSNYAADGSRRGVAAGSYYSTVGDYACSTVCTDAGANAAACISCCECCCGGDTPVRSHLKYYANGACPRGGGD